MSAIVEAFKIKSFDLDPIYNSWPSAPMFQGNPARDAPVDDWLRQIKEGCQARRVPKEYWHKVAQHYLGPHAKARFDELKAVMRTMHGGRYNWNWKRFKMAMRNMGWDIDTDKTEEIKIPARSIWWPLGRSREERDSDTISIASTISPNKDLPPVPPSIASSESTTRPTPRKAMSFDFSFRGFPVPKRSSTMSTIETMSIKSDSSSVVSEKQAAPSATILSAPLSSPPAPGANAPGDGSAVMNAPTWLVNATQALSFLTTEHPKTMTAISAVLITIGSIPAIPAISAGAGGAFLASGTAHAIGSIAMGVGSLLKAVSDAQAGPHQEPLKK